MTAPICSIIFVAYSNAIEPSSLWPNSPAEPCWVVEKTNNSPRVWWIIGNFHLTYPPSTAMNSDNPRIETLLTLGNQQLV